MWYHPLHDEWCWRYVRLPRGRKKASNVACSFACQSIIFITKSPDPLDTMSLMIIIISIQLFHSLAPLTIEFLRCTINRVRNSAPDDSSLIPACSPTASEKRYGNFCCSSLLNVQNSCICSSSVRVYFWHVLLYVVCFLHEATAVQ